MEFKSPKHNICKYPKKYVGKKNHIHKITLSKKSLQGDIPNQRAIFHQQLSRNSLYCKSKIEEFHK